MSDYQNWKTVAIRLNLLMALHRIYEKTGDSEDKATRVVSRLVEEYIEKRTKELKLDLSDIMIPGTKS